MPARSGVVVDAAADAEGARPRGVPGKRSTTVRRTIHDAAILSDVVAGFFGESEEKHGETLPLMEEAKFDRAFVFACSLRGKTHAHRTAEDDGPGQRQEPEAERDRRGVPTERALEELRGGGVKAAVGTLRVSHSSLESHISYIKQSLPTKPGSGV